MSGWPIVLTALSVGSVILGVGQPVIGVALSVAPTAPMTCPVPGSPSSFWGYLTLNGAPAPIGLKLAAWINGIEVAYTTTQATGGSTYYLLDVPDRAIDPATGEVCRQGGTPGETVWFALCNVVIVEQRGTWNGGTLARLDLSATGGCGATPPEPISPTVGVRLVDQRVELSWLHIVQDSTGHPLDVVRYDIWRNSDPYFTAYGAPYASVLTPSAAEGDTLITFKEGSAAIAGATDVYLVRAISAIGRPSPSSNRVGIFVFALDPGSP